MTGTMHTWDMASLQLVLVNLIFSVHAVWMYSMYVNTVRRILQQLVILYDLMQLAILVE